ncbi:MAG: transglycosylase SLT domain-containing protein [Kiloniellales bacterium]
MNVPVVTPRPIAGAGNRVRATPRDFGGTVGVGLANFGQGAVNLGGAVAEIAKEQKRVQGQAEIFAANNQAAELGRNLLYDPQSGYFGTSGQAAAQGREETIKAYERGLAEIRNGLSSQRVQNEWDQRYGSRKANTLLDIDRHALAATKAWSASEREGRIVNETDYAAQQWADPQRLATNIGGIRQSATLFAQEQGYGPEQSEAYVRGKVSVAHFAAVSQMLASNQVVRAANYLANHAEELTAKDRIAAATAVQEAATVAGGQVLGEQAIAFGKQKTGAGGDLLVQQKASDGLFSAVVSQESGGDASAISPKGAVGLAQVMPDTARWVASQLGETDVAGMDDQEITTWLQTPENSARYGRWYLDAMLERFDGDTVLALAAYNGGPENVEKWIEKNGDPRLGQIDALAWADLIPFAETRNYVGAVLARASRASQPTGGGDWYAVALEQASQIEDPEMRAIAVRQVEAAREGEETVAKRKRDQVEAAAEAFIEDGGNPDDLPAETRRSLGAVKMNQLRTAYDKRADRQTDFELYDELSRMPAAQMADYDLFSVQHRLAPEHYKELKQRKADARKIVGGDAPPAYSPFTLTQRRTALYQQLGINGAKDSEQRGRLSAWIDQALRDEARRKGGPLTAEEENRIMHRSLTVISEGGWFSGDTLLGEVDELSDLPDETRQALADAFPEMTEQQRLEAFMILKLRGEIQ